MAKAALKNKKRIIPEGKAQVNFNLDAVLSDKIKYIAWKEGTKNSDQYGEAVARYVEEWERKNGKIRKTSKQTI